MEMINNSSSSQTFVFIFFIIIIIIIFSLNQYVVAAHTLRLNVSSPGMAMSGSHAASNLLDEKPSSDETYVGGVDACRRCDPPSALAAAAVEEEEEEVNIPSQKDKDKDSGAGTNNDSHFSSYPSTSTTSSSSGSESECVITGNSIDDCWRCDPNRDRKRLAECGIGFGREAAGGLHGHLYVVTDSGDDDPVNPRQGTLRHAAIQTDALWITFSSDMAIRLRQELLVNSFKTIDGRGHNVHIAGGGCITLQYVSHIIIHGLHIHDCRPTGNAMVRSSPTHVGWRTISDGDAISLFGATHVWIDHCSLSRCADGLVDAIMGSTAITISNNYFSHHDKVMLLGHSDSYTADKSMQVTIVYNRFGEGLVQRMPRCRHGVFEIVNNDYSHWEKYAIGGSAAPAVNSRGNRYMADPKHYPFAQDVTKRIGTPEAVWERWDWRSEGDMFVNGAYFTASGGYPSSSSSSSSSSSASSSSSSSGDVPNPKNRKAATMVAKSSSLVSILTAHAGPLSPSEARLPPVLPGSSSSPPLASSSSASPSPLLLPLDQQAASLIIISLLWIIMKLYTAMSLP